MKPLLWARLLVLYIPYRLSYHGMVGFYLNRKKSESLMGVYVKRSLRPWMLRQNQGVSHPRKVIVDCKESSQMSGKI